MKATTTATATATATATSSSSTNPSLRPPSFEIRIALVGYVR